MKCLKHHKCKENNLFGISIQFSGGQWQLAVPLMGDKASVPINICPYCGIELEKPPNSASDIGDCATCGKHGNCEWWRCSWIPCVESGPPKPLTIEVGRKELDTWHARLFRAQELITGRRYAGALGDISCVAQQMKKLLDD